MKYSKPKLEKLVRHLVALGACGYGADTPYQQCTNGNNAYYCACQNGTIASVGCYSGASPTA
jgi:hypothetical protein